MPCHLMSTKRTDYYIFDRLGRKFMMSCPNSTSINTLGVQVDGNHRMMTIPKSSTSSRIRVTFCIGMHVKRSISVRVCLKWRHIIRVVFIRVLLFLSL